jgi:hypothetical protein
METYTRLLMDANPELPIHFLNIYMLSKEGDEVLGVPSTIAYGVERCHVFPLW